MKWSQNFQGVLSTQQMAIHQVNAESLSHKIDISVPSFIRANWKYICIIYIYYNFYCVVIIGSISLGLGRLLGGCQVPLSDFANDKYLPRSSQPPKKAQSIGSETWNASLWVHLPYPTLEVSLLLENYFLQPYAYRTIFSLSVDGIKIQT